MHSHTRPYLALLIAFTSLNFSRFGFCYDESPWQPTYDYYHIDLGELGGNHGGHHERHHGVLGSKGPVPRDVMVDVINDLGIKLLAIHNERNENNIAISPYGALSVLAALSEGVQGDAVHEILHAVHLPKDKHITRIGLRDIHRHLKSYFIPEEGFLAGLTLNLNNVTLRSEYEDILRFYGFDYGSFNNALYPEPLTTQKPFQGTTLGTSLGMTEGTTIGTTQKIEDTTTILTDTRFGGPVNETSETTQGTTEKEITSTLVTTIQGKEEVTTGKTEETTTVMDTTAVTTTIPSITVRPTLTTVTTETTTQDITSTISETTTVKNQETTITELLQTSGTSAEKTTETINTSTQQESTTTTTEESTTSTDKPATESVLISTKITKITTKISDSSTELPETTTNLPETTTMLTKESSATTDIPPTTTQYSTTQQLTSLPTEVPATTIKLSTTTATESPTTTSAPQTTSTEFVSTIVEADTTTVSADTTVPSETTIMTEKSGEAQRTTRQISAGMMPGDQLTTLSVGKTTDSPQTTTVPELLTTISNNIITVSAETTTLSGLMTTINYEISTSIADTTTAIPQELTTMSPMENTEIPFADPETPFEVTDIQNDFVTLPVIPNEFSDQPQGDVESTTPFFFGTTPDFQDMTTFSEDNFDYTYNYDASIPFNNNSSVEGVPPVYDDNMANLVNNNLVPSTPEGASFNRNLKRRARSVVDYVIARYYDDHHFYIAPPQRPVYAPQQEHPQRPEYVPQPAPPRRPQYVPQQEPLTFAVYGKYRESGINFMKYDTVLPFFYVPNLNALSLSFPLDSTKYYLLLLLPVEDNGVDQLICDLRLHGNLKYIIEHLKLTHVVATIPSFMLKGYVTLTHLLQRLGIRRIFEPRQADFSPMTNVTDIYVTNIEQAVTVTIRNYLDPSAQHYKNFHQYSPVHFKADHPFLYFVVDSELHVALMVGKVINPLNSRIR